MKGISSACEKNAKKKRKQTSKEKKTSTVTSISSKYTVLLRCALLPLGGKTVSASDCSFSWLWLFFMGLWKNMVLAT